MTTLKRVLPILFWGMFMLAMLSVLVVRVRIAMRSGFFLDFFRFDGVVVRFGNDVIQYAYVFGGIGSIAALALWVLTKRGKPLAIATGVFVAVFGGSVYLNRTDRVCELKKKENVCVPTLYGLSRNLTISDHMD